MKNLLLTLGLSVALPLQAFAADAPASATSEQSAAPVKAEKPAAAAPASEAPATTPPAPETSTALPAPDKTAPAIETAEQPKAPHLKEPREISDWAFSIRDTNKDGKITSYEHTLYSKTRFSILDQDRNGFTTLEEYYKFFKDSPGTPDKLSVSETFFAMEDIDKDGKITQYESLSNSPVFYKKMDTNQDDAVTPDEFFEYQKKISPIYAKEKKAE